MTPAAKRRNWRTLWLGIGVMFLAGCAQQPVAPPGPTPAPPVRARAEVPASPATVLPVAILISRNIPAYTQIADRLEHALGNRSRRYLLGEQAAVLAHEVNALGNVPIVAIGLRAALLAEDMNHPRHPVIFCQVFNYQAHDLVSKRAKGVSMLPSFDRLFATWHELSPGLRHVVTFTGKDMEQALQPAVAAAAAHGISLTHETVRSDKELLYRYKNTKSGVEGLWLLPDNRILSRAALTELMSYSMRNAKQVVVFSNALLPVGGLFSAEADPDEIADKVLSRLKHLPPDGRVSGPHLVLLERAIIRINPVVARRLNLTIPREMSLDDAP